ncbi:MAG: DUF4149 domain-containing protein [Myxococcaceae bacterium]|nr:DUF4149 domain-containing protein [Myxococcaceae bacterium]
MWLYELSVWLHILAACAWIGGMAFLVFVVVPLLRRPDLSKVAAAFVQKSGERFRILGWTCLGILVATGSFNMWIRGIHWSSFFDGTYAQNPSARALAWKLLLVAAVLVVSAIHDFYVGPRATRLWEADPTSAEAKRARRQASRYGRINGTLALIIVLLAVFIVRGIPLG